MGKSARQYVEREMILNEGIIEAIVFNVVVWVV
jgi:hypothetical protein